MKPFEPIPKEKKVKLKTFVVALALVAIAVVASGCGSDKSSDAQNNNMAGMTGMDGKDGKDGNQVDAMFVAGMIPHHEAAVDMAELGVKSAERSEIKTLSKNIIASQNAEIEQMQQLQAKLPATSKSMMNDQDMSAMMSQTDALKDAKDFDKAFIDAMIPHHQSAIMMAEMEIDQGTNPEVVKIAKAVVAAQTKEIAEMQSWRTDWYGKPLPTESTSSSSMGSMKMNE